jgi:hypothetical protein
VGRFAPWIATGLAAAVALADGVREVEVVCDPPDNGQRIYTVRLRPARPHTCSKLVFDCTLRQEFPWEVQPGRMGVKTNEPAVFTYRRKDVKMVEDLDCFVSFRVPVSIPRLQEIYGLTAFHTNFPVAVSRIKVTGFENDQPSWTFETEARGVRAVSPIRLSDTNAPPPPTAPGP